MKEEKKGRGNRPNISLQEKVKKYTDYMKISKNKPYNYIYTIPGANQRAVIENNWDLDIIDLAIYAAIKNFILSDKSAKYTEDNIDWYFIDEKKIIMDLPLVPINSPSAIYKRINKLCVCNLIERHPDNKKTNKKLIRLGSNYEKLIYTSIKP